MDFVNDNVLIGSLIVTNIPYYYKMIMVEQTGCGLYGNSLYNLSINIKLS